MVSEYASAEPMGLVQRATIRKSAAMIKAEISAEEEGDMPGGHGGGGEHKLERNLGVFDLLCVGIGGTIGTGIFALCGLIASSYAGPSIIICWAVGGFGCLLSSAAYVELATRIPTAGSAYAYAYYALGEVPAVIAAWCLSLEYGISASAVARTWGNKLAAYMEDVNVSESVYSKVDYKWFNVGSGFILIASVAVLLAGVGIGKNAINVITSMKVMVVLFMIIGGLINFQSQNLKGGFPPAPGTGAPKTNETFGGWNGVFLGTTQAFFGYIGFDEVCCMGAEAKNPSRTIPLAVMGTVIGTAFLSGTAGLALVGMQHWSKIDPNAGFGKAFEALGWNWAGQIVQIGELVTLPVVVLVSFLAQPRLQYAMAIDGLLPPIFARTNKGGNLFWSIIIGGIVCLALALFVPFTHLNDLVSGGILLSFNITNCSLLMVRRSYKSPERTPKLLIAYMFFSCVLALFAVKTGCHEIWQLAITTLLGIVCVGIIICIWLYCPASEDPEAPPAVILAPFVPILPCSAIMLNFFLVAQLSWGGLIELIGYIILAVLSWAFYGRNHSKMAAGEEAINLVTVQK